MHFKTCNWYSKIGSLSASIFLHLQETIYLFFKTKWSYYNNVIKEMSFQTNYMFLTVPLFLKIHFIYVWILSCILLHFSAKPLGEVLAWAEGPAAGVAARIW